MIIRDLSTCISLLGYHNKIQTGWLKQHKIISYSSGVWEIHDQGASNVSFILRPLLLDCRQLPSGCMFTWPLLVHAGGEKEGASSLVSLLIRELILLGQGSICVTSFNLITSLEAPVQIRPHWIGTLTYEFWRGTNI